MPENEQRATWGADAIYAAAEQSGVAQQDTIQTCLHDVLAYIAHFCDRAGLDPEDTFQSGLRSYEGDSEDGPPAVKLVDGEADQWAVLDAAVLLRSETQAGGQACRTGDPRARRVR